MKNSAVFKITLVLAASWMIWGCSKKATSIVDSAIPQTTVSIAKAAPSVYTNCLSMPVVWAEGHGLTGEDCAHFTGLRGTYGEETFTTPYDATLIDGYPVYRNPSINEWQAQSVDGTTMGVIGVELDWADNMTRQTWTDKSKVRVEIVLFKVLATPLKGYNMYSLGGTQLDEVFVTNSTTYDANMVTVYSNVARLKIEKLDAQNGVPVLTVYDSPVYEKYFVDGPLDAYSAEINMGGKCIYGFNWNVRDVDAAVKSGWYRLTFNLDPTATYTDADGVLQTYSRNTKLNNLNPLDLFGANDPEVVLYQPTLAAEGYSSTLDIYIKPGSGSTRTSANAQ